MTTVDAAVGTDRRSSVLATTTVHGRTTITARALDRVVAAVAGTALGVQARSVTASITDERGRLALSVRAPIRIPSLTDVASTGPDRVARGGGSILDRAERARAEIAARVHELTGSTVARVVVRLESADITKEKRVG